MREELTSTTVAETSRSGAVGVTVNPGGILTDLRLGRPASDLSLIELAAAIMETYQRAIVKAAKRSTEIMTGLVGEDSDAMRFLRAAVPEPEPDSPRRARRPRDEGDEPPRVLR
ncbi:MAG: YbaB/EbfC family nucleoid-associated protein [Labedaea sp.]